MRKPNLETSKLFFYSATEQWGNRFFDALTTLILIRNLNAESFGLFAIYQSWVGILLFFLPNLELQFYRNYGEVKAKGLLPEIFSQLKFFNFIKIFITLLFVFFISYYQWSLGNYFSILENIAAFAFAFALPLSQAIYGSFREPLRFEYLQKEISITNTAQKISLIITFLVVGHYSQSILSFSLAALVVFIIFGFAWYTLFKKKIAATHIEPKKTFKQNIQNTLKTMGSTVLWIHINGALTVAVQTLDVYFISKAGYDLRNIAIYSLALKAANFALMIPMPFSQLYAVYWGKNAHTLKDKLSQFKLTLNGLAIFSVLSLVMLFLGSYFSLEIMSFLSRGKFSTEEISMGLEYYKYMLYAACVYVLCFPFGSYINSKTNIKYFSLLTFVPWTLLAAFIYKNTAATGLLGVAKANILVYGICTALHILFFIFNMTGKKKTALASLVLFMAAAHTYAKETDLNEMLKKSPEKILETIRKEGICIKILDSKRPLPANDFAWGKVEEPKELLSAVTSQKALLGKTLCQNEHATSKECLTIVLASDAPKSTLIHEYLHAQQIQKSSTWCDISKSLWNQKPTAEQEDKIRDLEWEVHLKLLKIRNHKAFSLDDKIAIVSETLEEAKKRAPRDKTALSLVKKENLEKEFEKLLNDYRKKNQWH